MQRKKAAAPVREKGQQPEIAAEDDIIVLRDMRRTDDWDGNYGEWDAFVLATGACGNFKPQHILFEDFATWDEPEP